MNDGAGGAGASAAAAQTMVAPGRPLTDRVDDVAVHLIQPDELCGNCRYGLAGVPRGVSGRVRCPECGGLNRPMTRADAVAHDPIARARERVHGRTVVALLVLLFVSPFVVFVLGHASPLAALIVALVLVVAAFGCCVAMLVQLIRLGLRLDALLNKRGVALTVLLAVVMWAAEILVIWVGMVSVVLILGRLFG